MTISCRGGVSFYLAGLLACSFIGCAGEEAPVLRSVRSVRVLNFQQAAQQLSVNVTGVVTHANPYIGDFFIDDGTAPIYVSPGGWKDLKAGDKVRIEGKTSPGGFAPCLVAAKVEKLGTAPLPDPQPYDLSLEDSRWLDAHYVQCWPFVEDVTANASAKYTVLRVSSAKGTALVLIPGVEHAEKAKTLLKMPVRVRGVCVPTFNERKVVERSARIFVQSLDDIIVQEQAPVDFAANRSTLLGSLYHFIPDAHPQTRRVKIVGTVTASDGAKTLYIRDASAAARVQLLEKTDAVPGEVIEVTGMLVVERQSLTIDRSSVKNLDKLPPPEPTPISLADASSGKRAFEYALVEGTVAERRETAGEKRLLLKDGNVSLEVLLPLDANTKTFPHGSRISAAGIVLNPLAGDTQLRARSIESLKLLAGPPAPPYWTSERVTTFVGGALVLAVLAGIWAYTLRRRVQQQTRLLQEQFAKQSALEQQMRQSHKLEAMGRLAGGIAHDFNNLLTVIIGSCDLLSLDKNMKPESGELLKNVRKAGERAASLTRQMLLFSRHRPVSLSPLELNHAVEDSARMVTRLIGEHINVKVTLVKNSTRVLASEDLINQILMNLGANARDAISDAGTVSISTSITAEDKVRLTFADSGCGMDVATKERIFEPFFTTKEVGKGTGLGLATVFGIVKTLGANITCESEPGKGTTFNIDFPHAKNAADATSPMLEATDGRADRFRGMTVLLVEDNIDIAHLAEGELKRAGFEVLTAHGPDTALEIWKSKSKTIQLLVTDVVMPKRNGRELADELQGENPSLPVLFMSGHNADELLLRGIREDRIVLLQKPFTGKQLIEKVSEVLGPRRGSGRKSNA